MGGLAPVLFGVKVVAFYNRPEMVAFETATATKWSATTFMLGLVLGKSGRLYNRPS